MGTSHILDHRYPLGHNFKKSDLTKIALLLPCYQPLVLPFLVKFLEDHLASFLQHHFSFPLRTPMPMTKDTHDPSHGWTLAAHPSSDFPSALMVSTHLLRKALPPARSLCPCSFSPELSDQNLLVCLLVPLLPSVPHCNLPEAWPRVLSLFLPTSSPAELLP